MVLMDSEAIRDDPPSAVLACDRATGRLNKEWSMPETQIFHLAPTVLKIYWLWTLALPVTLMAIILVFAFYTVFAVKNAAIEIDAEGLRIEAGFYSRNIPTGDLALEGLKTLNLVEDCDYALSRRRNGVSLPGLKAGWYTLNNGEKALVFVTDPTRVVYAPTRKQFSLLFSASDPKALLDRLKKLHAS
jgi:hypothetical protein